MGKTKRKRQPYDYEAANKLGNYVRKKYSKQLKNGTMSFYLLAFPHLEQKRCGLCGPITANYAQLAAAGCRTKGNMRTVLSELSGVLCEVEFGESLRHGATATRIRRYKIGELQSKKLLRKLIVTTPDAANQLATTLQERPFRYGDNPACQPYWDVARTGRVKCKEPYIQGHGEGERATNLRCGLAAGEVLISLDFKAAEPSLIQQLAAPSLLPPSYDSLTRIMGIPYKQAKRKVNTLAYVPTEPRKIVANWPKEAQALFADYATSLDAYRNKLWDNGAPSKEAPRHVYTVGGTRITADRGAYAHRGQILSWHIQGTVADIVNSASLEIIAMEAKQGWRYCFPVHDSVYVIGQPEHAAELERIMRDKAAAFNLRLCLTVNKYEQG